MRPCFMTVCAEIALVVSGAVKDLSAGEEYVGGRAVTGRLAEIVENVRANEELLRNLEYKLVGSYELVREVGADEDSNLTRQSERRVHAVWQDGMEYLHYDEGKTNLGGSDSSVLIHSGFDGSTTRLLEQARSSIGNIHKGRFVSSQLRHPHTLIFIDGWLGDIKFSEYLTATKYSGFYVIDISYLGEELVGGLPCLKLRTIGAMNPDSQTPNHRYIWICPERNYFPVKTVGYALQYSEDIPLSYGEASDFREIEPGVWLPFRYDVTVNAEIPASEGRTVVSNRRSVTIEEVNLYPDYDVSFFRDIPFPEGTFVVELDQGEATKSGWKGDPPPTPAQLLPPQLQPRPWYWWWWLAAIALIVAGAAVYLHRRRGGTLPWRR